MIKKEIQLRKLYLNTLKTQLLLEDNAAVTSEMTARAKQIEGIIKALGNANINCDNIPGLQIFFNLDKNLIVKKYLKDLFFFETNQLSKISSDEILIAEANLAKFSKGEKLNSKDSETYELMKNEFSKMYDQINNCLSYYQIEDIKLIRSDDKPISRMALKLLPSYNYLQYLKKIKFISNNKFTSSK